MKTISPWPIAAIVYQNALRVLVSIFTRAYIQTLHRFSKRRVGEQCLSKR